MRQSYNDDDELLETPPKDSQHNDFSIRMYDHDDDLIVLETHIDDVCDNKSPDGDDEFFVQPLNWCCR